MLTKLKGWLRLKRFWAAVVVIVIIFLLANRQKSNGWEKGTIQKGEIKEELILSGDVEADKHVKLMFPASGKVASVDVVEGEKVSKNQLLAKLDTTLLNADYERAVSDLRSAQASVDKALDDVKNHDTDETFTQKESRTIAEVARDKAYRNLVKAQENLANATLRSPFEGIVSQIADVMPGANIIYTQSYVEVVNPETIYFSVTADQTDVTKITAGQPVDIIFDIASDKTYKGEVAYIGLTPKSGEASTVYEVKLKIKDFENNTSAIRVGMTGDAMFTVDAKDNALYVEEKFVQVDTKGKYLLVGPQRNRLDITTGIEGDGIIEVIGDVHEGQDIYDHS